MSDQYYIDLEGIKLDYLQTLCETGDVLPSEKILVEDVQDCFAILRLMGIDNLADLSAALKTKKKLESFSQATGLPVDYLTILRRRVGFYTPKPVPLNKITWMDQKAIQRLAEQGIKNTRQLMALTHTQSERDALSRTADVTVGFLLELVKLSDLLRAPFVGPVYARLFYAAGADTLVKLAAHEPTKLCEQLRVVNAEQKLTKAGLPGESDMASFLELIRLIPNPIQY